MDKRERLGAVVLCIVKAGLFFLAYFVSQLIVGGVLGVIFAVSSPDKDLVQILNERTLELSLFSNLISIVCCILIMRFMEKKDTQSGLSMNVDFPRPVTTLGFCLALGVFGQLFSTYVLNVLIEFPEEWVEQVEQSSAMMTSGSLALQIVTLAIVAPLAEEIIFRACIQGSLSKGLPSVIAIALTSVIFGVMHGDFIRIIYATILGALMCWLYSAFKSIFPSLVFHLAYNMTSLFITGMSLLTFIISTIFFAISLAFIIYLYCKSRKQINIEGDNNNEAL